MNRLPIAPKTLIAILIGFTILLLLSNKVLAAEFKDGVTIQAADIIRELNTIMRWVSYPNRKNAVVPVEQLDFNPSIK